MKTLFFLTLILICLIFKVNAQWSHQNSGTTERFMTSCFIDQNLGCAAGNFEVEFNASALSSGIYYYKLVAGDFVDVKKMILLE